MRVLSFAFLALTSLWCGAQPIQPTVAIRTFGKSYPMVTVQSNGDFYVHGSFDYINRKPVGKLAKLSSLGDAIETFAHVNANGLISQVHRLPSNKLLITGYFNQLDGTTVKSLIRLNEDGSHDNSFVSAVDNVTSFAVQSNNEIVVRSGYYVYKLNANGSFNSSFSSFYADQKLKVDAQDRIYAIVGSAVVRRKADGSADPSFTPATSSGTIYDYDFSPSGDILVGGTFTRYNGTPVYNLVLLDQNGNMKSSFNAPSSTMSEIYTVLALSNGKFLIAGLHTNIFQVETDGSISGNLGIANTNWINSLDETPDHKVLVEGEFTEMNSKPRTFIALFNENGSLNEDFVPIVTSAARYQNIAVSANGSMLTENDDLYNVIPGYPAMKKFNGFGKQDESFSWDGMRYPLVRSLLYQESDKFLVAGYYLTHEGHGLIRYNGDGSQDNSFSGILPVFDTWGGSVSKVVEHNGTLYACGQFITINGQASRGFIALTKDGQIQKTFNSIPENQVVVDFGFQSDGKIILCLVPPSTGYANIIRINLDGTVDNTFPTYGLPNGGNITIDASDRIYVSGDFWEVNDVSTNRLLRLSSNGSIDNSFTVGAGPNDAVWCLQVLPDNTIALGGYFTTYDNAEANGFVMVDENGAMLANPPISFTKDSQILAMTQGNKSLFVSGRLLPNDAGEIFTLMKYPLVPEQKPSAPEDLKVEMAGKDSLGISWTDTSEDEIAFILERSVANQEHFLPYDTLSDVNALDVNVTVGTEYFYRVRAVNYTSSSDYSNVVSFIPYGWPAAPTGLSAQAINETGYTLLWKDESTNEAGFIIERSLAGLNQFVLLDIVTADIQSYKLILTEHESFEVRICAYNVVGKSAYTNAINVGPITAVTERAERAATVYPNPAQQTITISSSEMPAGGTWVLTNAMGIKQLVQPDRINNGYTLDISTLPSGWYHLAYLYKGTVTFSAKVIRN